MGWERRGGRYYLYRNRRVNGRPVKEYLGCQDPWGFGELLADDLDRLRRRQAKVRRLTRQHVAVQRGRVDQFVAAVAAENDRLRTVADGVLSALGYHRHHQGEWRMRRDLNELRRQIAGLTSVLNRGPNPVVLFEPPADDAEAVDVFARARAGDEQAQVQVRGLIRTRRWREWLGNIGRQATVQLIAQAAGGDAVFEAGLIERTNQLRDELRGPNPSPLEDLLVRRVVNGWLAVHHLELELAVRPPRDLRAKEHLDKAVTRAQRRMTSAVAELARVRRLQAPLILAQLMTPVPDAVSSNALPAKPARS